MIRDEQTFNINERAEAFADFCPDTKVRFAQSERLLDLVQKLVDLADVSLRRCRQKLQRRRHVVRLGRVDVTRVGDVLQKKLALVVACQFVYSQLLSLLVYWPNSLLD